MSFFLTVSQQHSIPLENFQIHQHLKFYFAEKIAQSLTMADVYVYVKYSLEVYNTYVLVYNVTHINT